MEVTAGFGESVTGGAGEVALGVDFGVGRAAMGVVGVTLGVG